MNEGTITIIVGTILVFSVSFVIFVWGFLHYKNLRKVRKNEEKANRK